MASTLNPLRRLAHTVAAATPSSTSAALALIRSQPNHYVVAAVAGRKYLLAPRDVLTVPRLKDVRVGDTLALDGILEIGSREYTLRGSPIIDPSHVSVSATVVEHTKGRMENILKFKKRKGYKKIVQHKQTYTRLRIGAIDFAPASASAPSPPPPAPTPSAPSASATTA